MGSESWNSETFSVKKRITVIHENTVMFPEFQTQILRCLVVVEENKIVFDNSNSVESGFWNIFRLKIEKTTLVKIKFMQNISRYRGEDSESKFIVVLIKFKKRIQNIQQRWIWILKNFKYFTNSKFKICSVESKFINFTVLLR